MRTRKREQTRGCGACFPRENFRFKSSGMAINASKTTNSDMNFLIITSALKQQVTTLAQNLNE